MAQLTTVELLKDAKGENLKDMQPYAKISVDDTEQPQIDLREQALVCHILTNSIIF